MGCNGSAAWQAYKRGAMFGNPCFVQIHPTCIPVHGDQQSKLTLMSESLRNDGLSLIHISSYLFGRIDDRLTLVLQPATSGYYMKTQTVTQMGSRCV